MSQVPVYLLLSLPLVGAYALFAVGIVVMYRASRVLNLAQGAMAMVPAYVTYSLWRAGLPMVVATVLGVSFGALLGLAVDRIFVARLRGAGTTAQTVGTVAVLSLLIAVAAKVWGTTPLKAPTLFPDGRFRVSFSFIQWGQVGLFFTALAAAAALFAFFRFTDVGLAMRGSAENRRAAALMGVNPDRMSALAMLVGGGLAGLCGILLAGVTNLHPFTLSLSVLPAFVAALIGGLESLPGALVGAALVGVVEGMVPAFSLVPGLDRFAGQVGAPQLVLTIFALIVMAVRGQRLTGSDVRSEALGGADDVPAGARRSRGWLFVLGGAVLVAPLFGLPYSILGDLNLAAFYVIITCSLVLLTGWVGQISLAHAAFVGISAFVIGLVVRGWGIPFPVNVVFGAAVSAGAALVLGVVALRVRGLYLAVATLIFSWMADTYLFNQSWIVGAGGSSTVDPPTIGPRGGVPFFDFADRRTFFYAAVAAAVLALAGAANLRDSKTGRAFFAVRGSEMAAASLGIAVTRYKLLAFGISGALAGIGGTVLMIDQRTVVPAQFTFTFSLFYLSLAVVGGLTSLGGGVAAALVFAGLQELFFRVQLLKGWLDIVSASLLVVVLLAYRGGLAAVPASIARLRATGPAWARRLLGRWDRATEAVRTAGAAVTGLHGVRQRPVREVPASRMPGRGARVFEAVRSAGLAVTGTWGTQANGARPLEEVSISAPGDRGRVVALRTQGITVRFGGLLAADDVSLEVGEGEIVGLIGPNGAGKTTVFNAISGLVGPVGGSVWLRGLDVTGLPVHERARLGLGRTFQVIQLFPTLTVFDNLLVATHLHNHSSVVAHLLMTERSVGAEREARRRVEEVVDLIRIRDVADRRVAGLPFGVLRMVELARALVTDATVLMLDESASGLDSSETERLAELLFRVRDALGLSMLLIEHDVAMVTSVSDYMYVLDRGRLLASGTPRDVARDPHVIAAYLGVPEEETVTTSTGRFA